MHVKIKLMGESIPLSQPPKFAVNSVPKPRL